MFDKYFDYAATTPCSDTVLKAMQPYWQEIFGNPNSTKHKFGQDAKAALEQARANVANAINANVDEIIFTSGATEANNLALRGFALGVMMDKKKKIISTQTEHKCVIETLRALKIEGFDVVFLLVDSNGLIDLQELESHLPTTSLVSISYVNNETGVVQDMKSISNLCREYGVVLHTDAVQALGKIRIDARKFDLISFSGHKIYGPNGVGVLFVSKNPRIHIASLFKGGDQERGIRPGTQAVPLCVGMGIAAKEAVKNMEESDKKAKMFHDLICENIIQEIEQVRLNGATEHKVWQIVNLNISFVEGESLMMKMPEFALSSGSACTSASLQPSHVICAMYPNATDVAHSSLRISTGYYTTEDDVLALISVLKKAIEELRSLSPLWAMYKKGIDLTKIKWNKH